MTKREKTDARRLIFAANQGSVEQMDAIENEFGDGLTNLLDGAWDNAAHSGEAALASQLESAYTRMVG